MVVTVRLTRDARTCMAEFTKGQIARMHQMWEKYRQPTAAKKGHHHKSASTEADDE